MDGVLGTAGTMGGGKVYAAAARLAVLILSCFPVDQLNTVLTLCLLF
jgi:hypothetical protein